MNKQILFLMAFILILGSVFAAPQRSATLTQPSLGTYWKSGANEIKFTALDNQSNDDLNARIYYSVSAGAFTTLINSVDLNLYDGTTCGASPNFVIGASCTYSWNVSAVSDGNYYVDVNLRYGTAGSTLDNNAVGSSASFMIDKINPTTSWNGDNNVWKNSTQNITFTSNDGTGSSGGTITYRKDKNATNAVNYTSWDPYSSAIEFSSDGNWAVNFYSTDRAGNVGDINIQYVLIDKSAPSTSWDGNDNSPQNFDANIHLTCDDGAIGIGCSTTKYRLDTDSTSTVSYGNWTTFDTNILITADGNYAIDFNSTDLLGNIGGTKTYYVIIDKTAPAVANTTSSTQLAENVTLSVTTNENATCRYSANDVAYSSMSNTSSLSTSHSWTLSLASGIYNYYVRCMDAPGNINSSSTTITFNAESYGGENTTSTEQDTMEKTTSSIPEGSSQTITYSDNFLNSIKLIAEDTMNATALTVKTELDASEEGITIPENSYELMQITLENSEGLGNAEISFKVLKSWITKNKYPKQNIVLMRLFNDNWTELPTTYTNSDLEYYYFKATTPGFSYFTITIKTPEETVPTEETTNPEQETKPTIKTPTEPKLIKRTQPKTTSTTTETNINETTNKEQPIDTMTPLLAIAALAIVLVLATAFVLIPKNKSFK